MYTSSWLSHIITQPEVKKATWPAQNMAGDIPNLFSRGSGGVLEKFLFCDPVRLRKPGLESLSRMA